MNLAVAEQRMQAINKLVLNQQKCTFVVECKPPIEIDSNFLLVKITLTVQSFSGINIIISPSDNVILLNDWTVSDSLTSILS